MASIKTKFTVGLFIAIGLAVTIVLIIWLGMSKYLEKGRQYVAFFDESVQGLDRDSPVKYRGVPVGRVTSVNVAPDGALVQVIMKIETELTTEKQKDSMGNVVAQLKAIGITGIVFIELDRKKANEPDVSPKLTFLPKHPVIATKPSEIKKILQGVDDILKQFKALDGKGITENLNSTVQKISQAVDDLQLKEISTDIRASMGRINTLLDRARWESVIESIENISSAMKGLISNTHDTVRRIDRMVATNGKEVESAVSDVRVVIQNAGQVLARLNQIIADNKDEIAGAVSGLNHAVNSIEDVISKGHQLIEGNSGSLSELQQRIVFIMQNLEKASEHLNTFMENIAGQPAQLLFGDPPPEKKVAPVTVKP